LSSGLHAYKAGTLVIFGDWDLKNLFASQIARVTSMSLEFRVLLPQSLECWDFRHAPLHAAKTVILEKYFTTEVITR
jgi:hypothetical protein